MIRNPSDDPRSIRARQAFLQALKELLIVKPFEKISVTDISKQAGFARHTFYNHYDTKEELLYSAVDTILDKFFSSIGPWDKVSNDPEGYKKTGYRFFEIWKEYADVVKILNAVDIDCLLITRLKAHFLEWYYEYYAPRELSGASYELSKYIINFHTYSFVGILRQWFQDDMCHPPEVMGQFWNFFAGIEPTNNAIQKFKDVIR